MHPASNGERVAQAGEVLQIVAAGFAPHERDDAEGAEKREGVNRGVEQGRRKSLAPAGDETEQGVAGVRDRGIGEEAAQIRLRERDKISDHDREGGERGQERRPAGDQRMPGRAAVHRAEGNEHNFSEDNERRDLRAGSDEGGAGNRRSLDRCRAPRDGMARRRF